MSARAALRLRGRSRTHPPSFPQQSFFARFAAPAPGLAPHSPLSHPLPSGGLDGSLFDSVIDSGKPLSTEEGDETTAEATHGQSAATYPTSAFTMQLPGISMPMCSHPGTRRQTHNQAAPSPAPPPPPSPHPSRRAGVLLAPAEQAIARRTSAPVVGDTGSECLLVGCSAEAGC